MRTIFSPKSRLTVSRPLALFMNTLNMLAPALLLLAFGLAATAKLGDLSTETQTLMIHYALILVIAALIIRVLWGGSIRLLRRRTQKAERA
jgi:membrane protein implicated in regulation of membrane protease activity